jgi:hypothetical protein
VSTAQDQAFEALCSALYMNPYSEFLGETDRVVEGQKHHWAVFHLGEKPKDIRVTVVKPPVEEVRVRIEWRNYAGDARNPLKGEQTLTVKTYAADQAELEQATTAAITSVLEVYLDVLNEEGVAGDIEKLAPPVEDTDDEE